MSMFVWCNFKATQETKVEAKNETKDETKKEVKTETTVEAKAQTQAQTQTQEIVGDGLLVWPEHNAQGGGQVRQGSDEEGNQARDWGKDNRPYRWAEGCKSLPGAFKIHTGCRKTSE